MGDDDEDEDDINFYDENQSRAANKKESNPESEYEGEFGYSLIKALRGKSVGRRLKRNIFKFGVCQLLCNFALLIITILESEFDGGSMTAYVVVNIMILMPSFL